MNYDVNRTKKRSAQEFRKRISLPLESGSGSRWFKAGMPMEVEVLHLPPGATSWPNRFQTWRWGLYSVEKGTGRVRTSMGLIEVRAGDCILQSPGMAYQIINSGEEDLWLMIVQRRAAGRLRAFRTPEAG